MLRVLELRLRKHILEVLLLLLACAYLWVCLISCIILVFYRWATHAVFSVLRVSDGILSFVEGSTVVALRVLLHRYHRQISLNLYRFAHLSFRGCSSWQRRQCGVTCLNTGLIMGSASTLSNRFSHRVGFLHGHIVVLFVGIRQRLVNHWGVIWDHVLHWGERTAIFDRQNVRFRRISLLDWAWINVEISIGDFVLH